MIVYLLLQNPGRDGFVQSVSDYLLKGQVRWYEISNGFVVFTLHTLHNGGHQFYQFYLASSVIIFYGLSVVTSNTNTSYSHHPP